MTKQALDKTLSHLSAVEEATQRQRAASNPMASSWVGASAGSGKTKVLTDRILRLLLPRENAEPATRPEKILALTFTKAAANEMSQRLSKRLSQWAVMDDDTLRKDMDESLLGRTPTKEEMIAARKLFARVIDAPGGINIMTLHSFCQSVLGRFPIEAGIPPHFKALEESEAAMLLKQATDEVLAGHNLDSPELVAQSLARLATLTNEEQFEKLVKNALGERHQFQKILDRTFGVDGLYTKLCQSLGVQAGSTPEKAIQDFVTALRAREKELRNACMCLSNSDKKTSQERGQAIQFFLDQDLEGRVQSYQSYKSAFLKDDGDFYKNLATQDVINKNPDVEGILTSEAQHLYAFEDTLKSIACTQSTKDLFTVLEEIISRYQTLKTLHGGLDFDDLILKTLALFQGDVSPMRTLENVTPWVMFKMDGGIDHILVDEAQDTNPEQWEIIRLLAQEFFTGDSAKEITRTLFVVGDEKQSIFGFQRAAPEKFGDMFDYFQEKIKASHQKFDPVDINTSFRSSQAILNAVDATFIQSHAQKGMGKKYAPHRAQREGQEGIVELWPILKSEQVEGESSQSDEWSVPDKVVELRSGSIQMAKKIGDMIFKWLDNKENLESRNRPIQPGDILVLVRSRNAFVMQLVRELKTLGVPVSGVDRMVLAEQLVVQDLCAAINFALLPEDDLTLACLLKSPFIGINEEELYVITQGRAGHSLWQAFKEVPLHKNIQDWLESLIVRASESRPYEFLSHILQTPCPANSRSGLEAVRSRLGEESLDPLNEFLNAAILFESGHSASLQEFIKWHKTGTSEIKRDLDEGGGVIRIMTIHGAKGLQAPIVFLPDTVRQRNGAAGTNLYWHHKTGLELPFYCPSANAMPKAMLPAKERLQEIDDEEGRRLLYVAMTRAEDRLYIGGYYNKKKPSDKTPTWHKDIESGLLNLANTKQILPQNSEDKQVTLRLHYERTARPDKAKAVQGKQQTVQIDRTQSWIDKPAPKEPFPPKPLIPSRPSEQEPAAASPLTQAGANRFKRGIVTHKALQYLPQIEKSRREAALKTFLANPAQELSHDIQDSIFKEVITILNDPVFGDLFGQDSMAEVPITGLIGGTHLVSGQIDRMLVRENEVLVVDFKTNRPPPQNPQDVPSAYIRQMEIYRAALKAIYPNKAIRTALLWTDGAMLMEI